MSTTDSPPAKRSKTEEDVLDILSPHILTSADELVKSYGEAKPYPHGRVENMFDETFLGVYLCHQSDCVLAMSKQMNHIANICCA